jgi:hypothetical protein
MTQASLLTLPTAPLATFHALLVTIKTMARQAQWWMPAKCGTDRATRSTFCTIMAISDICRMALSKIGRATSLGQGLLLVDDWW